MSAAPVQPGLGINDTASNIYEMWREAVEGYEKTTSTKISGLQQARTVDDILEEIQEKKKSRFLTYRHNYSKSDKLRTAVRKNLEPLEHLGSVVAQAVSMAFPPVTAIFTAVKYLIKTANRVTADYDKIEELFEDIGWYLRKLKIYERGDLGIQPEHRLAHVQVFTSILMFSGICTKYLERGRVLKAVRTLLGEDKELETAHKELQKTMKYENEIAPAVILSEISENEKRASQDRKMILENTEHLQRRVEDLSLGLSYLLPDLRGLSDQRKSSEREEILKWLSPFEFNKKHQDTFGKCHPGTGRWLLQTDEFQRWFKGKDLSTLLCHGIPGSGKSITTSVAVHYIQGASENATEATAVAFLYCDYEYRKTKSECQLLSSIAKQLTEQISSLPFEVAELWQKSVFKNLIPRGNEWISLIRSLCQYFQTTYLLVDALDECPKTNRDNLLSSLQGLVPCVRFLFTSRPHIGLPYGFTNVSHIEISATEADLEKYLESRINTTERFPAFKFLRRDPDLQGDIIRSISTKAAGMFLLARLQIDFVLCQNNLDGVREAVTALPQEIDETYGKIVQKIEAGQESDTLLSKRALSYVACARRPLNVAELLHALSVKVGDTELDKGEFTEVDSLLSVSMGLLRLDKKSDIIGLVHHTLQEYFAENPGKIFPDPEAEIARTCLTYLSFKVFGEGPCDDDGALNQRLLDYRFYEYASNNWGYHSAAEPFPHLIDFVAPLLKDRRKLSSSVQALFLTSYRKRKGRKRFPSHFGPLHIGAYWGLMELLEFYLKDGVDVNAQDSYGTSALHVAAEYGHVEAVRLLIGKGATINTRNHGGETALYWAARNGHWKIVELLFSREADIIPDGDGWTCLTWTAFRGNDELVKMLLGRAAPPSDPRSHTGNDQGSEALYVAAEEGYDAMLQVLIDSGVDVNVQDSLGSTALDYAVSVGHTSTTQALLKSGADIDSRDCYRNTALHWAVRHEKVTRLLLERGADVFAKNQDGQAPLCWAVQDGLISIVEMLLGLNAEVDISDTNCVTPLHRAAFRGCEKRMRVLLKKTANANVKDKDGWTPLHWASIKQHRELVKILRHHTRNRDSILAWVISQQSDAKKSALLVEAINGKCQGTTVLTGLRAVVQAKQIGRLEAILTKGAEVNGKDLGGWTALELAAIDGLDDVVHLLLEHGADVNLEGSMERPALYHAIEHGNETTVQALIGHGAQVKMSVVGLTPFMLAVGVNNITILQSLLEAGSDVNALDYYGQTALHLAANYGQQEIVQLLMNNTADLNIVDEIGWSVLMHAVYNSHYKIIELLLDRGADIDARAQDGSTALHLATYTCDVRSIRLLLDRGASINATTRTDFSALHIAILRTSKKAVKLLLGRGADVKVKAQWDKVKNSDGITGQEASWGGPKALCQLLQEKVVEQGSISFEGGEPHTPTTQQLAKALGLQELLHLF